MVSIVHNFVSAIADDPAALAAGKVVPQTHWNAGHTITLAATQKIVGRKTAGAGAAEEVSLSEFLDFIGSAAQGDVLFRGASGWQRLGVGAADSVLKSQGAAADLIWGAAPTAPFADDSALVKGSSDATKKIRFEVDGLTTGTTRVLTVPDADFTIVGADTTQTLTAKALTDCTANTQSAGNNSTKIATTAYADAAALPAATQSDMETATSNVLTVTPGRLQYHPGAAKAWCNYNAVTNAILSSYNISSVTDNGSGDFTFNFTNAFSGADAYIPVGIAADLGTAINFDVNIDSGHLPTASACRLLIINGGSGAKTDVSRLCVAFFGDQ